MVAQYSAAESRGRSWGRPVNARDEELLRRLEDRPPQSIDDLYAVIREVYPERMADRAEDRLDTVVFVSRLVNGLLE